MMRENKIHWLIGAALMFALAIGAGLVAKAFTDGQAGDIQSPVAAPDSLALQAPPTKTDVPRESVTFVLGEDSGPHNRYYSGALAYYRMNPTGRTERLVTDLRSLLEVRDYLEANAPADGRPWGRINLVVHSNEWTGIDCPVLPDARRANAERLRAAMNSGDFPPIADAIVDARTALMVYGCALGRNQPMLDALSEAFGGQGNDFQRPVVRSSRYFVQYAAEGTARRPYNCQRYMTDFHYAFYRTGYRPADYQLVRQLRGSYPGDSIDFAAALARKSPRFPGDAYHHTFRVPVVWLVTYDKPEDRPDFTTEAARMTWLDSQTDLKAIFEKYQLSQEQFTWTFQKIRHADADGNKVPAVKLIGLCDVLCVLQPLTVPGGTAPLVPALSDARYYGEARAPELALGEL